MKYGIICAVDGEIDLLLKDIESTNTTKIAGRNFIEGTLYGSQVVLVMSRIGKVASASTATTLIDRFAVDCVLFCGTAGGINRELNVGDVIVGDYSVQHDVVVAGELFTIPRLNVGYFKSDKSLTDKLLKSVESYIKNDLHREIPQQHLDEFNIVAPKVVMGTIASGDQFICDGSKNDWLSSNVRNVQCVEMEGAAVAQVCYEFGVPFCVVRVISDNANESGGIDFDAFIIEAASHYSCGIVKAFLKD